MPDSIFYCAHVLFCGRTIEQTAPSGVSGVNLWCHIAVFGIIFWMTQSRNDPGNSWTPSHDYAFFLCFSSSWISRKLGLGIASLAIPSVTSSITPILRITGSSLQIFCAASGMWSAFVQPWNRAPFLPMQYAAAQPGCWG